MSNMYDSANDIEKAIRNSVEFKELVESYHNVMNDEEAKQLFEAFRDTQMNLQEKQMEGIEISQEEIDRARQIVEKVQQNEMISKLIEKEQRLNLIIDDISRIITRPLEDLYEY
ncbi:cell fate (sporulation/competence/biofilm development) regulator YlbF (YheA/YmcA/DUF963 family) [Cerasibacillus quisquiliarum]|uniref:UPF0342 protein CQU01_09730 n=1 Tax=Cerasibacillus quisquiliarum TaxID=227865 RepID=A0A511UVT0_9BACI|nr:YlbF family regulator [Cerasibacillus quisquiliarum]MBB5146408.1 cell fate (sporulation/competence/biofilm development) regulator YlbF (YheA/YmcA/DUF963 family) [Cerasibacillus quisquiliarum]GEN30735.1 hypothetical protein CQU01_09730 [Cerasibacillus quisquiliarum]